MADEIDWLSEDPGGSRSPSIYPMRSYAPESETPIEPIETKRHYVICEKKGIHCYAHAIDKKTLHMKYSYPMLFPAKSGTKLYDQQLRAAFMRFTNFIKKKEELAFWVK